MNKLKMALAAVTVAAMGMAAMADVSFTVDAGKKTADFAFDESAMARKLYLAYGNADGGDTTNGWDACTFVQTVAAGATTLNDVALPAGYGKQYRVMRAFLEKPMTAKDYVQDGLVVLYDCRENVGWGAFDASATTWRNLVSDDRGTDLNLNTTGTPPDYFETDNVHLAGSVYRKSTTAAVASEGDTISMEFNMKPPAAKANEDWFALVRGLGRVAFRYGVANFMVGHPQTNGKYCMRWFGGLFPTDSAYHTYTAAGFTRAGNFVNTAWSDGVKKNQTGEYGDAGATTDTTYLFQLGFSQQVSMDLRSVRVYTKKLSDADIAHNRAVDESRFGGEAPLESSASKVLETPLQITKINKAGDGTPVSIEIAYPMTNIVRKVCIAWGKTDAGDVLADWENKSVLTNAVANSAAMTVLVPPEIGAEIARRGFRVFLGSTTARDYVQKDLIVLYDCRENAGWGTFVTKPSTWRNLVSDNRDTDMPLRANDSFGTDNAYLETSNQRVTTGNVATSADNLTMEFNMKPPATSGSETWFAMMPGLGRAGFRNGNNTFEVAQVEPGKDVFRYRWFSGFPTDSAYHLYTAKNFNAAGNPYTVAYLDGASKAESGVYTGDNKVTANYTLRLGAFNHALNLRSVRIYSRDLTDAERQTNIAVDDARFGDGYPFNTEATDFTRVNGGLFIVIQ